MSATSRIRPGSNDTCTRARPLTGLDLAWLPTWRVVAVCAVHAGSIATTDVAITDVGITDVAITDVSSIGTATTGLGTTARHPVATFVGRTQPVTLRLRPVTGARARRRPKRRRPPRS